MPQLDALSRRAGAGAEGEGEGVPPGDGRPRSREDVPDWRAIWAGCARRIASWGAPPRWSAGDWREEAEATALAAAWRAALDFDPARGAAWIVFARLRILAAVRTRHRQECSYARHCGAEAPPDRGVRPETWPLPANLALAALADLLADLPEADRRLIEHLFWRGGTEADLADALGISQQAVSKRKRAVLRQLRRQIEGSGEIPEEFRL